MSRTSRPRTGSSSLRPSALALVAFGSVLALAGCGSDAGTGACSLLDQAGIEDATGVAVQKGQIDDDLSDASHSTCAWRPESGTFPVILVYLSPGGAQVVSQRSEAEAGDGVPAVDIEIAGAHDAYAAGNGSLIGMVVDDTFIQVAYLAPGTDDALDKTTALAAQAAAAF